MRQCVNNKSIGRIISTGNGMVDMRQYPAYYSAAPMVSLIKLPYHEKARLVLIGFSLE